jgi:surface carbohydrate biosynthesis protein
MPSAIETLRQVLPIRKNMQRNFERKRVVLLVDSKKRDLLGAALVAYQLERHNIECFLEPLEAYRGSLAARRPHMIIFNHLVASHLAKYSARIAKMGVLTSVLINEGLCYEEEERNFNAGKYHKGAHIDYFFCWNQPMKEALEKQGFTQRTHIEVVGPPRFDFYHRPWSAICDNYRWPQNNGRPKLLVCSNFGLARYYYLPKSEAEKLFASWSSRISDYRNWWSLVEANQRAQEKFLKYLRAILESKKFDMVFRPHPREDVDYYRRWLNSLTDDLRRDVSIEEHANITSLLLACDVHVGCEDCNTIMESWIAGKPTLELIFERHPVFCNPSVAALSPNCEQPAHVVSAIEQELAAPRQERFANGRQAHLAKWCDSPSGKTTAKIADIVATSLARQPEPNWTKLEAADRRRALKLNVLHKFGHAYHYKPFLALRGKLLGGTHKHKSDIYEKSIRPKDVRLAMQSLKAGLEKSQIDQ